MPRDAVETDICLILEGTYPYTLGGVSGWTHELIRMQDHLTFSIIALLAPDAPATLRYELPPNVVSLQIVRLQRLPQGERLMPAEEVVMFKSLEKPLLKLQSRADLRDLALIIRALAPYRNHLGQAALLDSDGAWNMLLSMYRTTMPKTSFLDYFWSWRGLFGGLFSVLLAPLPKAKIYHALCTGYAGLLMARAHLETGRPGLITEHGIYTNERRIEIASADWLDDPEGFSLAVTRQDREIKDFWIDTFGNYSRLCYQACSRIVTLYNGNQEFQRMDGAEGDKLQVIPNGIDTVRFTPPKPVPHPPTVALIGRVVPIKDVKHFLKAVRLLKDALPEAQAFILGPDTEDPAYAAECRELAEYLRVNDTVTFTGKVNIDDYLPVIDLNILTSISEAQPLVVLETGAAGIPTIATDVGSCREIIMGTPHETPQLGPGGAVVPLANPQATAAAMLALLTSPEYYRQCSRAINARVRRYYDKPGQKHAYAELYRELIEEQPSAKQPLSKVA